MKITKIENDRWLLKELTDILESYSLIVNSKEYLFLKEKLIEANLIFFEYKETTDVPMQFMIRHCSGKIASSQMLLDRFLKTYSKNKACQLCEM